MPSAFNVVVDQPGPDSAGLCTGVHPDRIILVLGTFKFKGSIRYIRTFVQNKIVSEN